MPHSPDLRPKLIFDFDETLFTLQLPWDEWYHQDVPAHLKQLVADLDLSAHMTEIENQAVRQAGEVAWRYTREYSRQFERERLIGVIQHHDLTDLLPQLAKIRQIFLWTSNSRSTVEPILSQHGLLQYFSYLVTKDDVQFLKPETEGFHMIQDVAGGQLADYTMVGDSQSDREAAAAAGIKFIPRAGAADVLRSWIS